MAIIVPPPMRTFLLGCTYNLLAGLERIVMHLLAAGAAGAAQRRRSQMLIVMVLIMMM